MEGLPVAKVKVVESKHCGAGSAGGWTLSSPSPDTDDGKAVPVHLKTTSRVAPALLSIVALTSAVTWQLSAIFRMPTLRMSWYGAVASPEVAGDSAEKLLTEVRRNA